MNNRSRSDHFQSISKQGHAALSAFSLAPDRIHLNHGSYGAIPRVVQAEQDRLRAHIEADPTTFFGEELPGLMRDMAGHVARRFGGAEMDWVFCENATAAINGILASFPLKPGDEILTTSHVYGAVLKAMQVNAERRGAKLVIAELPAAVESEDQIVAAVTGAFTSRTRLLVIDHIASASAIIFPVAQLTQAARQAGIAVLIDGAHAPGQLPLDVPALGADWYTGNAHKWLFAPRGCGLLWTAPDRQTETTPAVLSHGTGAGYTEAFDWIGTRDVTPWLCFEISARAHENFGGTRLMEQNCALAAEGASLIAEILEVKIPIPTNLRGAMAAIPINLESGDAIVAKKMRQALTSEYGFVSPIYAFAGKNWVRISAQIYNELSDYRACAEALIKLRTSASR